MLRKIWKPDTFVYNGKKSYLHTITTPNRFVRWRRELLAGWHVPHSDSFDWHVPHSDSFPTGGSSTPSGSPSAPTASWTWRTSPWTARGVLSRSDHVSREQFFRLACFKFQSDIQTRTWSTSGLQAGVSTLPVTWSSHSLTSSPPRLVMRLSDSTMVSYKMSHCHNLQVLPIFQSNLNKPKMTKSRLALFDIYSSLFDVSDWLGSEEY